MNKTTAILLFMSVNCMSCMFSSLDPFQSKGDDGRTELHDAVIEGDVSKAKELLRMYGDFDGYVGNLDDGGYCAADYIGLFHQDNEELVSDLQLLFVDHAQQSGNSLAGVPPF